MTDRKKVEREFFEALDAHQLVCMRPEKYSTDLAFTRARVVAAFLTALDLGPAKATDPR